MAQLSNPSSRVRLFNKQVSRLTVEERKSVLEQYKLCVEMADRVSARRQSANNFYLTVNTAMLGATTWFSAKTASTESTVILALAGLMVSLLWMRNIDSYRDLNSGKFEVINELEQVLPSSPYEAEWQYLKRGQSTSTYRTFHSVERLVPWVFALVHLAQLIWYMPYDTIQSKALMLLSVLPSYLFTW